MPQAFQARKFFIPKTDPKQEALDVTAEEDILNGAFSAPHF